MLIGSLGSGGGLSPAAVGVGGGQQAAFGGGDGGLQAAVVGQGVSMEKVALITAVTSPWVTRSFR